MTSSILSSFFPDTFGRSTDLVACALVSAQQLQTASGSKVPKNTTKKMKAISSKLKPLLAANVSEAANAIDTAEVVLVKDLGSTWESKHESIPVDEAPNTLFIWPTLFFQPESDRKDSAFFEKLGSDGPNWVRRFLGVYYEAVMHSALKSYFLFGTNLTYEGETIAVASTMIQSDMRLKQKQTFGQVAQDLAAQVLRAWANQVAEQDKNELRENFELIYQAQDFDGNRVVFADFKLEPKNKKPHYLLSQFKGIGQLCFEYEYNKTITVEMKTSSLVELKQCLTKPFQQIEQATRDKNVSCLIGLYKLPAEDLEVKAYGKLVVLIKEPWDMVMPSITTVVERNGKQEEVRHFVGNDINVTTTNATNIWKAKIDSSRSFPYFQSKTHFLWFDELDMPLPLEAIRNGPQLVLYPKLGNLKASEQPKLEKSETLDNFALIYVQEKKTDGTVYALSNFLYVEWTDECKLYKYTSSYKLDKRRDVTKVWPELVKFLTTKFGKMNRSFKQMFPQNTDVYIFDTNKDTTLNNDKTLSYADTLWPGNAKISDVSLKAMDVYKFQDSEHYFRKVKTIELKQSKMGALEFDAIPKENVYELSSTELTNPLRLTPVDDKQSVLFRTQKDTSTSSA